MIDMKTASFEDISRRCAEIMAAQIAEKPDSILCLATGGSPLEAYRIFAHIVLETGLDVSRAFFVKLDEWHGIPMDNPATCETFLQRELFCPLRVHPGNILSFDSMAEKPEAECRRIADALDAMGPLDLTILGIGRNGHLGLNEPSEFLISRPHVAVLAEKTLGHAMLKEAGRTVSHGMTLGMTDLLQSRHIVMMVAGEGKEEASAGMLSGRMTTANPSSFLQLASKVTVLSAVGNRRKKAMQHEIIGRPVRIVSLGFSNRSVEEIARAMDQEGEKGADLIILPETWTGTEMEKMDGPAVTMCSSIAKKHHAYVVCPVYREDALGKRWNTAILLDREGNLVFSYDKNYPYWSEFDLIPPCEPGHETGVYETDFGKIGILICFDVNFPGIWDKLAAGGAELVVWPSAYSAGTSLMAHAINHHFYVVSSTLVGDCSVFDITGQEILHEKDGHINISRITLDFDRCIFHENFNEEKRDGMLAEHADDVMQELHMEREQWFVLKARIPGTSARKLAAGYRMEELRSYLRRSALEIDRMKGEREQG